MDQIPPGTDLSQVPLQANPNGDPPNFVDPPSLINGVRATGIILGLISLVLVITRLRVYNSNKGLGLDDVTVVLAFVLAAGYTGMVCNTQGIATHAWDTPISHIDTTYVKTLFATSLFYGPMLFFAKASILLLYLRLFRPEVWLRWCVWITLTVLFASYWMTVPLGIVYCAPHGGGAWDFAVLNNCNHLAIPGLIQGAINILADIVIFALPQPIIRKLHIPTGKKVALAGIFATGLMALIASILTMYYRVRIYNGYDVSWAGAQTYICIQAEIYAAIWVACMPSLAKVWKTSFSETKFYASIQSLLGRSRGSGSKTSGGRSSGYRRKSSPSSESVTGLSQSTYSEARYPADEHARQMPDNNHSILKMTTFDVSSHARDERHV